MVTNVSTWYILHHLVHHNGKDCIVFSSSFAHSGTSHLLPCPLLGSMLLDVLLSEVDPFDGSHRDPSVLCKVIFCGRITIIPDPQLPDPGAFSSFQDLLKAYVLAIYRAAADLTPMTEDYRQAELALLWKQWCSQPVIPKHCHCPCWLIPDGTVSSQDAESHSNYNLIKVPTLKVATLNSRSLIRLPALPPIFFSSLLADQIKWIAPLLRKVGVISTKGQPVICSHIYRENK